MKVAIPHVVFVACIKLDPELELACGLELVLRLELGEPFNQTEPHSEDRADGGKGSEGDGEVNDPLGSFWAARCT